MAIDMQAIAEAVRDNMGMPQSGAGVPGGVATLNRPSPQNPMAQAGIPPKQNVPAAGALPTAGDSQNPSSGAISAMNNAQPGEATIIVKALINRLKQHPVTPGQ